MPSAPHPTLVYAEKFLSSIDVALKTEQTYRWALNAFAEFLTSDEDKPLNIVDLQFLKEDSLAKFRHWLRHTRGYNRRTESTYLAAAVRFVEWLDAYGHLPEGVQSNRMKMLLKESKGRRRVGYKTQPIKDTVLQIIEYYDGLPLPASDTARGRRQRLSLLRNRAIVHTLFATGLRAQELASLRRSDVASGHDKILITGKGEKERLVMLNKEAQGAIAVYLKARDETAESSNPKSQIPKSQKGKSKSPNLAGSKEPSISQSPNLFVRHDRATALGITTKTVWQVVSDAAKALGLRETVSPHDFRRYIATAMLSEGMPLESVQMFLGHESIVTTRTVYAHTWTEVLDDQVKTYRPSPKKKPAAHG